MLVLNMKVPSSFLVLLNVYSWNVGRVCISEMIMQLSAF